MVKAADRKLWVYDCRWRVRLAGAEHKHAVERLTEACREHDRATEAEKLARETLAAASEQLAVAEGRKK